MNAYKYMQKEQADRLNELDANYAELITGYSDTQVKKALSDVLDELHFTHEHHFGDGNAEYPVSTITIFSDARKLVALTAEANKRVATVG